jgi:hypothetical protein
LRGLVFILVIHPLIIQKFVAIDVISLDFVYIPLLALIPDLIPESQSGQATGWYQGLSTAGSLCACIVGLFSFKFPTIHGKVTVSSENDDGIKLQDLSCFIYIL